VGQTIGTDLKQKMKSIEEYEHLGAEGFGHFYKGLKNKAECSQTTLDLFAFSTEEIGLSEMYSLFREEGCLLVLGEKFSGEGSNFATSFEKV
jgi:hypothetical protein